MTRPFTSILALIDLPEEPDTYFHAAIEIANMFDCHLHVLCQNSGNVWEGTNEHGEFPIERIWMLQNYYSSYLKSRLSLHLHISKKISKSAAVSYVQKNNIDLVVNWSGKDSIFSLPFSLVRSSLLARDFGCPVILLPRHGGIKRLRNIILPMHQPLPAGKMVVAVRLARKFDAKIHLIEIGGNRLAGNDDHFLLKACQLLRDNTNVEVECKRIRGTNMARSVLRYGIRTNADIILSCTDRISLPGYMRCLLLTPLARSIGRIPVMLIPVEEGTALHKEL
jgi:hypothetical protein